jgi:hypothetical protein
MSRVGAGRLIHVRDPDAVAEVVLSRDDVVVARWVLAREGRGCLAVVDEIARLRLGARRLGLALRLRGVEPDLAGLIDLAGLAAVLGCDPDPADAA